MKNLLLVKFLFVSFFFGLIGFIGSPTFSPVFANAMTCNRYTVPVTLSTSDSTVYHVVGNLCYQGSLAGKTVQVTLHSTVYNHNYFDWPVLPQKYSYTRKATDEGYAVFTIDRLAYGESDHPLSTLMTIEADAFVVHELVQDLRNGSIGNTSFSKVILVGHSLGSLVALLEQSVYADTDGLILSSLVHQLGPGFAHNIGDLYPASQDPKFATSNFPGTYLTTKPGTKKDDYNLFDADPLIIASDELLKDTVPDGELATATHVLPPSVSQAIHVPVLLAMGQKDPLFCDSRLGLLCDTAQDILQRESTNYSSDTCLEAFILPNAGHSINLHLNAREWFEAANDWANRRVGNSTTTVPTQPCQ